LKNKQQSICLGLNQGTMSAAAQKYLFAELGEGQWVCEEFIFKKDDERITYSLVTKTAVKLLTIATQDLRQLLSSEYKEYLHEIAMSKHIAIFERAKEIIRASRDLHNQQDFKFFYDAALRTLVALHP
jgi:CRP-like cAMP-binding protein